jgi:hypothetical protein
MMSVLTSYDEVPAGTITLYLRMYGLERKNLNTLKKKIFEKAAALYMVDHREKIREFYDGGLVEASPLAKASNEITKMLQERHRPD